MDILSSRAGPRPPINGPQLEEDIGVFRSLPQASFIAGDRLREFPCGGVPGALKVQGVKVARIEFKGLAVAVIRRFIVSQEGVDGPAEGVFRGFMLQRGPNHKNAQAEAKDGRKTHQDKFHFIRHFKGKDRDAEGRKPIVQ